MPALCLCYEIHEPYRLRRYTVFDIGQNSVYEDDDRNCDSLLQTARYCYLPMTELLLKLIRRYDGDFRLALSVSCTALDQFEQYAPEILDSLKALAATGCVEFLGEPGQHTLSFIYSRDDFREQVNAHAQRMRRLFGKKPKTFRNTDLVYNNDLAVELENLGFRGVLTEGAGSVLGWRSANFMYSPISAPKMRLLMRNSSLSRDLGSRFSDRQWDQWPLTAEKYAGWCRDLANNADIINIFNDFHIFGLRNTRESGIFEFMEALPRAVLSHKELSFITPAEAIRKFKPVDAIDVPQFVSRSEEGDLNAWLGNDMQKDAIHSLYALAPRVRKINDGTLSRVFNRLQAAENFFYISTKWFTHYTPDRPSPYQSPYDAYITYMNVLADFEMRLSELEQRAPAARAGAGTARKAAARKAAGIKEAKPSAAKSAAGGKTAERKDSAKKSAGGTGVTPSRGRKTATTRASRSK